MDTIRIAIVEDEPDFQDWVQEEIASAANMQLVGAFDNGEEALKKIPDLQPDVIIMDLTLNKSPMDGCECLLRLKLINENFKFLVLSANNDEQHIFEALKVGAGAYLQKGDIPGNLVDLIRSFHNGQSPMSQGIATQVIRFFNASVERLRLLDRLTDQETNVLKQLSEGYLYKEIADLNGIKKGTIAQHCHSIYKKLGVNNRTEAVRKYLG